MTTRENSILQILALQYDPCRQKYLLSCLKHLEIKDDAGKDFTGPALSRTIKEMHDKGFIQKSSLGIQCHADFLQASFIAALRENNFQKISTTVRRIFPLPYNDSFRSSPSYFFCLRDFFHTLFTTDKKLDIAKITSSLSIEGQLHGADDPFLQLLNSPFNKELIDQIPLINRPAVLELLVYRSDLQSCFAQHAFEHLYDLVLAGKHGDYSPVYLLDSLCHRYRLDEMRSLLNKLQSNTAELIPAYRGVLEFILGNNDQALSLFEEALRSETSKTRKRGNVLAEFPAIIYILSILKTRDTTRLRQALPYCSGLLTNMRSSHYRIFKWLLHILGEQLGFSNTEHEVRVDSYERLNIIESLFYGLSLWWTKRSEATSYARTLERLRDWSVETEHLWVASETADLLAVMGDDIETNEEYSRAISSIHNTTPLSGLVKPPEKWLKSLQSLINLDNPSPEIMLGVSADQRLVWLMSYYDHSDSYLFQPCIQKLGKNGKWTKGRNVALKTLHHDHLHMEGLSNQDLKACGCLQELWDRSGYFRNRYYEFDLDCLIQALIDHPLIFSGGAPGVRIDLVKGEPELRLKREQDKLSIFLKPDPTHYEDDTILVKESPTRFKVIRFTPKHRKIAELIDNDLIVPESGFEIAKQVAASLSGSITVLSDVGGGLEVEEVPADPTPHIHLLPHNRGLLLNFLTKPLKDGQSCYKPGKGGSNVLAEINGKRVQAKRDLAKELELCNSVAGQCPSLAQLEHVDDEILFDDPLDCLELLQELKNCPEEVVLEWPRGERFKTHREVSFNNLSLNLQKDRDWFKATGSLRADEGMVFDLQQLLAMLDHSTGRFVKLDDDTYMALTKKLQKQLEELKAYSQKSGKGVRFNPLASLALDSFFDECTDLQHDKAWKQHVAKLSETINPELPSTLQAELRDYQLTGFKWLAQLSHWNVGACLADDMGLGKTLQALAVILTRAAKGPTLVVAPLSVMHNWREEAARFTPTLNVRLFGPGERQKMLKELNSFDLVVCSYGLLQIEEHALSGVKWQTIILDEAQAIKNANTKRTKAAMKLEAEFKVITTGTPLENHLGELWSLFNFINPGLLGSQKQFNEKYGNPITRYQDDEAKRRLRKLIRPFILRRIKNEVLRELPPRTDITLQVEMSKEEQALYEAQRLNALKNLEKNAENEQSGARHLRILAEIMKLRRLCCNPKLLLPDSAIAGSKLKVFGDTLEELLGNKHKTLVFSQFVDHLTILRDYLDGKAISYQYLDGSTSIKERQKRIKAFQNGEGDVFLISLKAGGSGLNLTAADYVIHMDPWWNPAVEDQASDRAHRIGQTRPVTVYRLVVKDTIEEQIVEMHHHKRDLAAGLLEGSDMAGKISADELLTLLRD